jgi:hypothetical protein
MTSAADRLNDLFAGSAGWLHSVMAGAARLAAA